MTNESAKILGDFLVEQFQQESKTTRKVLAAVPAENTDYKPSEKCMAGLQLAAHIAAAEAFFLRSQIDSAFNWSQPDLKTPAEVVAWYDENIPALIEQVGALPAEKFAQPLNFMGMMDGPAVTFLALGLKHGIHHRGQLSAYLRPMGGKVPAIYGPSADEGRGAGA